MLNMITVIKVKQSSILGSTVTLVQEKNSTYPPNQKHQNMKKKMKFYDGGEKFGFVSDKKEHSATSSHEFPCTDESCNHFNHLLNWKDILILKINVTKRESQHNLLWWLING